MKLTKFKNSEKTSIIEFDKTDADFFCRMVGRKKNDPISILAVDAARLCKEIDGRIFKFACSWSSMTIDSVYLKIKLTLPFRIARYTADEIEYAGMPFKTDKCNEISVLIRTSTSSPRETVDIVLSSNREILKMRTWPFECVSDEVYNLVTHMIEINREITNNARKAAKK